MNFMVVYCPFVGSLAVLNFFLCVLLVFCLFIFRFSLWCFSCYWRGRASMMDREVWRFWDRLRKRKIWSKHKIVWKLKKFCWFLRITNRKAGWKVDRLVQSYSESTINTKSLLTFWKLLNYFTQSLEIFS